MSDEVGHKSTSSVVSVTMPDEQLGKLLLEGKFIGYHDARYGVTSGEHQIVMKLLQHDGQFILLYLHMPYAYPIPDGVKATVKSALEAAMQKTIPHIEFLNSGTESEKRNIQFRTELGGEIK